MPPATPRTPAGPASPSKGKAKAEEEEAKKWNLGWWDLLSLVSPSYPRPIKWSNSSVIIPHLHLPQLSSHAIPNYGHGANVASPLPPPPALEASPNAYSPPSVIEVSPKDDFVFAFFPGTGGGEGVGCIWQSHPHTRARVVREWWPVTRGESVVAALWLGAERQRSVSTSTRLPPLGPKQALYTPTLVLVLASQMLEVRHLPIPFQSPPSTFLVLRASLRQPSLASGDTSQTSPSDSGRVCVRAAIGLGYDEPSILVATHSLLLPPQRQGSHHDPLLGPMSLSSGHVLEPSGTEWESFGPESHIDLCEVSISFDRSSFGVTTAPLPPSVIHSSPTNFLTNLTFSPVIPSSVETGSPKFSSIDQQDDSEDKASSKAKAGLYLVVSYVDFADYTSPPKSSLATYSVARNQARSASTTPSWLVRLDSTREFDDYVVSFISPVMGENPGILVGKLHLEGDLSSPKAKQTAIGELRLLHSHNLLDDNNWQPSQIISTAAGAGPDPPLSVAISPNRTLVATISSGSSLKLSIHPYPHVVVPQAADPDLGYSGDHPPHNPLLSALLSNNTATDVLRSWSLSTPQTISSNLIDSLSQLQTITSGMETRRWEIDFIKLSVDIYKAAALKAPQGDLKDELDERWKVALDLCSMMACETAYEQCREDNSFDPDSFWSLVTLAAWIVPCIQGIIKECVLFQSPTSLRSDEMDVDPEPTTVSPKLLHLLHPLSLSVLRVVVENLLRFRLFLQGLTTDGSTQMAKDVFFDLIDGSGIDFAALEKALQTFQQELEKVDGIQEYRRMVVAYRIPISSSQLPTIRSIATKLSSSEIVEKSRLFIDPSNLLLSGGETEPLTLSSQLKDKNRARDVVTKVIRTGSKVLTCSRCGGIHEMDGVPSKSRRWTLWEKGWTRCICGGSWQA